ncbi:MAG TPA: NUDIX hydrolase [Aggregatilineales bacterium]|nr:NUDIX hydrolase [Aggregatilineales bacterium]
MKPYQTLNSKIVFKNPWYQVKQDDVILPNGDQTIYNRIDKGNAVWIVPVLPDGRVVLINQYRYAIDEWCIEIPAGGIYGDQTPEAVARQELKEEIGGEAESIHFIGNYWTMNGIGNEMAYFYLAQGVTLGEQHHEPTEVIELSIVEAHEAIRMARSGEIADGPSALALILCENLLR